MTKEQINETLKLLSTMIITLTTLENSLREMVRMFELEIERKEIENEKF